MLSSFVARRLPVGEKDRRDVPWGMAFAMSAAVEENDVLEVAMEIDVDVDGEAVGGEVGFVSS